jgi:chaperone modulatory protein CbpM
MLNPEEFCLRAGIERTTLELWLGEGWLVPLEADTALLLSDVDLARARLIRDLRDGMGVNDEGIGIILDLIDQVHGLRSILQGWSSTSGQRSARAALSAVT